MLNKKERLTTKEFDRFFKSGRRIHSPLFTLVYNDAADFHGAVVVGKKVSKKAVQRNKFRRRVYNALYSLSREKGLKGVYIVLTKPAVAEASFSAIKESLQKLIPNS